MEEGLLDLAKSDEEDNWTVRAAAVSALGNIRIGQLLDPKTAVEELCEDTEVNQKHTCICNRRVLKP